MERRSVFVGDGWKYDIPTEFLDLPVIAERIYFAVEGGIFYVYEATSKQRDPLAPRHNGYPSDGFLNASDMAQALDRMKGLTDNAAEDEQVLKIDGSYGADYVRLTPREASADEQQLIRAAIIANSVARNTAKSSS